MAFKIAMIGCAAAAAAFGATCGFGQEEHQPSRTQTEVTAEAIKQAQEKLTGGKSLQDQMDQAKARTDDVQAAMRTKAALLSARTTGKTAEQMRQSFSGNAQVANAERKPCQDPQAAPPADGAGLCQPGAQEPQ